MYAVIYEDGEIVAECESIDELKRFISYCDKTDRIICIHKEQQVAMKRITKIAKQCFDWKGK